MKSFQVVFPEKGLAAEGSEKVEDAITPVKGQVGYPESGLTGIYGMAVEYGQGKHAHMLQV
jgi:hypothetical protein